MSLPPWLDPLAVAEEMRETDRWAIEERGVPSLDLMERAGAGLADLVTEIAPSGFVAVVCGGGNNGGDGFVAARLLRAAGRQVLVMLTSDPAEISGDAKVNLDRLGEDPHPPQFNAGAFSPPTVPAVVVDAILGTGFSGAVREPARAAIEALNALDVPVVAADVPSGVDATTGAVEDVAVRAAATATFHQAKPGLWIHPGKEHAGIVRVVEIGIPDGAPVTPSIGLLTPRVLDVVPRRGAASTKFTSGHVLVVGGARGLTGAPCLAAEGAMRAGAGYVTCCVPASLNPIFEVRLLEVMTIPLPDEDGHLSGGVDRVLEEASNRGGALVVGPGLSKADGAVAVAREIVARAEVPVVLDADGLNAYAGRLEALAERPGPTILTPHAGELKRLLGEEVADRGLEAAREAARRANAIVVLKGDDTIIAEPPAAADSPAARPADSPAAATGRVAISPGGAPALATAGTGDVLSGVIAAMLSKGLDPFTAACAGVRLHLDAGRAAAIDRRADSVIARDVVEALGR